MHVRLSRRGPNSAQSCELPWAFFLSRARTSCTCLFDKSRRVRDAGLGRIADYGDEGLGRWDESSVLHTFHDDFIHIDFLSPDGVLQMWVEQRDYSVRFGFQVREVWVNT